MTEHPLLLLLSNTQPGGLRSAWDFFLRGGIFMIPLGMTSIAGLMAILYKMLSLSRKRVIPAGLEMDVVEFSQRIEADKVEPIFHEFRRGESTLARLGAVVLRNRGRSQQEISHAVEASAREETVHLHAGIGVLDTVITVAPLLGLLGTASGLVVIFQGLGETTDHLMIARGIAEALNTTILGLIIAVPCIIAHTFFTRKIETLTARLEFLLGELASACKKPGS